MVIDDDVTLDRRGKLKRERGRIARPKLEDSDLSILTNCLKGSKYHQRYT